MRIIVTGSRDWENEDIIRYALRWIKDADGPEQTVIHGACPTGADAMADRVAAELGFTVERHPADWGRHGRAAGPRRNTEMVNLGADLCYAFIRNHSRGATGCADLAEAAGMRTYRWFAP